MVYVEDVDESERKRVVVERYGVHRRRKRLVTQKMQKMVNVDVDMCVKSVSERKRCRRRQSQVMYLGCLEGYECKKCRFQTQIQIAYVEGIDISEGKRCTLWLTQLQMVYEDDNNSERKKMQKIVVVDGVYKSRRRS